MKLTKAARPLFGTLLLAAFSLSVTEARAESIRTGIRKNDAVFKRCYDEEVARTRKVVGRINVRIIVDPTGKVVETTATKNTTKSGLLAACVVEAVRKISFGKRKERTIVVHTFRYPRR
jgi:hypothetical protein